MTRSPLVRCCTLFLLLLLPLSGCALLTLHREKPTVGLTSIRLLPGNSLIPQFEIGLRLVNPDSHTLPLEGIVYSLSLDGRRILSGVNGDLPKLKGYSETDVTLRATVDIAGGAQFLSRFLAGDSDLGWTFKAKLDTGRFSPDIHIEEKGNLGEILQ